MRKNRQKVKNTYEIEYLRIKEGGMSVSDLFFTTGQAGRELAVSMATIRSLCATGAIQSQSTPGGQYRLSRTVIEKLEQTGLPSLPRRLPGEDPGRPAAGLRRTQPELPSYAYEETIEAADEVVRLEAEVKALGLRQRKEEALDWFRARAELEAETLAEQQEADRKR